MHELGERQKKHLMLYNWIATTIVREARGDVAAVTVYCRKDEKGAIVYYAKNTTTAEDLNHVNSSTSFETPHANQSLCRSFKRSFFLNNCFGKAECRFNEVRDVLLKEYGNTNQTPLQQLKILLQSNLKNTLINPFGGRRKGNADEEALKLTGADHICSALIIILESIRVYASTTATAEVVQHLPGQAWIIGRNQVADCLHCGNI